MRRESLWLKFVRYWYGIDSKLDERQLAEVERIGNNAYVISGIVELILLVITLIMALTIKSELALWFLPLAIAIMMLMMSAYTYLTMRKFKMFSVEITADERPKAIRRIWIKAIIAGIIGAVFGTLGSALGASSVQNNLVNVLDFWPQGLWLGVCCGAGSAIGRVQRLKVIKEDE
ncbi:hypothetical protein BHU41_01305 [Lactobacillus crispatus]|jgi:hypothetical protein|uniref:DUF3278 domain-containing protein n=1 Tax=Lactobacillus crispatus TaxID=47770 RepID=A0A2M9WLM5_9LACO|nr:DUF3278 domain-containing protein [Lactobacillus crispatus]PJZ15999.1 hypothetical protein BHU41_01305 [Lactobacillus crispatus]